MTDKAPTEMVYVIVDEVRSAKAAFRDPDHADEYAERFGGYAEPVQLDAYDPSKWPPGRGFGIHVRLQGTPNVQVFDLDGPPDARRVEAGWLADPLDPFAMSIQCWTLDRANAERIGNEQLERMRKNFQPVLNEMRVDEKEENPVEDD